MEFIAWILKDNTPLSDWNKLFYTSRLVGDRKGKCNIIYQNDSCLISIFEQIFTYRDPIYESMIDQFSQIRTILTQICMHSNLIPRQYISLSKFHNISHNTSAIYKYKYILQNNIRACRLNQLKTNSLNWTAEMMNENYWNSTKASNYQRFRMQLPILCRNREWATVLDRHSN